MVSAGLYQLLKLPVVVWAILEWNWFSICVLFKQDLQFNFQKSMTPFWITQHSFQRSWRLYLQQKLQYTAYIHSDLLKYSFSPLWSGLQACGLWKHNVTIPQLVQKGAVVKKPDARVGVMFKFHHIVAPLNYNYDQACWCWVTVVF